MTSFLKKIVLLFIILAFFPPAFGQQSAMSYNIRYDNPKDGINQWTNRKEEVVQMLNYYQPDLLGIQEGLNHQVAYLDSMLVNYKYIGVGRDDGKRQGEFSAIFYKTDRMKVISSETYWLSSTPGRVSVGWDASMERITTFGIFLDQIVGDTTYIFNTHFDHKGEEARLNSAYLILKLVDKKKLQNKRLIVMGDFNCLPEDAPMQTFRTKLLDPTTQNKVTTYGPFGTFNGFDPELVMTKRIDYILAQNIDVQSYWHIDDRRKNKLHLSDHLPVFIQIKND